MKKALIGLAGSLLLVTAPTASAETTASGAPCDIAEFSVYFAPQETSLTEVAERALRAEAKEMSECRIATISARVISSDGGTENEANALSAARTEAVVGALMVSDVDMPEHSIPVQTISTGTTSEDTVPLLARRVDIQIVPIDALNS